MAENGTPPAPAEEVNGSGKAAAPERGVQLDVDKMIESLLSYEKNPGKQVGMWCVPASLLQLQRRLLPCSFCRTDRIRGTWTRALGMLLYVSGCIRNVVAVPLQPYHACFWKCFVAMLLMVSMGS